MKDRNLLSLLILVALSFTPLHSTHAASDDRAAIQIIGPPQRGQEFIDHCEQLLLASGVGIVPRGPEAAPVVYVGRIHDLGALLRSAVAIQDEGVVEQYLQRINFLFEHARNPEIRRIIDRLEQTEDRLFICVLDQNCSLDGIPGPAFSRVSDIQQLTLIVPEARLRALSANAVIDESVFDIVDGTTRIRFTPRPNDRFLLLLQSYLVHVDEWVAYFFHELSHFIDIFLLRSWIDTNLARISNNKAADPVFRRFTRIVSGRVLLSEEFYRVYSESRAWFVTVEAMNELLARTGMQNSAIAEHCRRHAFEYLQEVVSPQFLREIGVTERNVLTIWRDFHRQMRFER